MLIPGPLAYLIYEWFSSIQPSFSLGLAAERKAISSIIASFSFTMLGFLAAVITILFTFAQSKTLRRYKDKGYLDLFFLCYFVTIVFLVITCFLALAGFSNTLYIWVFRVLIMSFVNNIMQIAILTLIIFNLARNASKEA